MALITCVLDPRGITCLLFSEASVPRAKVYAYPLARGPKGHVGQKVTIYLLNLTSNVPFDSVFSLPLPLMEDLSACIRALNREAGNATRLTIGYHARYILKCCSPQVLSSSYFYICSYATGKVLMLESLPVPLWDSVDIEFTEVAGGERRHQDTALDVARVCKRFSEANSKTSHHAFLLSKEGVALGMYKKKVCNWIVENKAVDLHRVPHFIVEVAMRALYAWASDPELFEDETDPMHQYWTNDHPVSKNSDFPFYICLDPLAMYRFMANDDDNLGWGHYSNKSCGSCHKKDIILKGCSACKQVRYCSTDCQKQHWASRHSAECKHLRELCSRVVSEVRDVDSLVDTFLLEA